MGCGASSNPDQPEPAVAEAKGDETAAKHANASATAPAAAPAVDASAHQPPQLKLERTFARVHAGEGANRVLVIQHYAGTRRGGDHNLISLSLSISALPKKEKLAQFTMSAFI